MVVAVPRNSSPIFSVIGNAVKAVTDPMSKLFQKVFLKTDATTQNAVWQRVVVKKMNEDGSFYKHMNEIGRVTGEDALFEFVVHNPSGTLYVDDPLAVVGFKCVIIALANPIFAAVKMLWYAGRVVVDTAVIATNSLREIARLRSQPNSEAALAQLMKSTLFSIASSSKENLWRVVSAPLFALGVEIGAFVGLISPYHGRALISQVEKLSQNGKGIREYYCLIDDYLSGRITSIKDCVEGLSKKEVCFLAMCFQSRGSLLDTKKFHVEKRMPIKSC